MRVKEKGRTIMFRLSLRYARYALSVLATVGFGNGIN